MKLFLKPGACSLSPHIILEEAGLTYETDTVDVKKKLTGAGEDYLKINPKGYVPSLQLDNGDVLTEAPAVLQYIADQVPEKKLVPALNSLDHYRLQAWLTFIGTELHKSYSPFFNRAASDDWKAASLANIERRIEHTNNELEGKTWLMGDNFTIADAYLFVVLRWSGFIKLDLSRWPNVAAYMERVGERPAVKAALAAEGLS